MTPGEDALCVFAVKRGRIDGRFDVRNQRYAQKTSVQTIHMVSLGQLTVEEPCYGTSSTAVARISENQPKYIRITDFDGFGIDDCHEYLTAEAYSDKHLLKAGDVLFARTGGTVGKTYYYDSSIGKAIFAGYCIRFRFDESKVVPRFAYWCTKTEAYRDWVKGIQRPSGQPNINKEEYKSFEIPLPKLTIQKKLTQEIDIAAKQYSEKLQQANDLLAGNSNSLIERLGISFDKTRNEPIYASKLSDIDGRIDADFYSPRFVSFRKQIEHSVYPVGTVDSISEKITTGFAAGKQDQADDLPEKDRIPQLRPFSITPEGELSFETQKYVPISRLVQEDYCKKNEVIFNNTNSPDWVGKTTVFDADVLCATSNHMTRITVKDTVNPYYVAAFFNVLLSIGYWKLLCTNFNNQAGVNTDTLKRVIIPIPPREVQDSIANGLMQRRSRANSLRKEAIRDWTAAKARFEKELLGGVE